ncbi:MAG: ATP-binding protein [Rhodospirillaceae bacterium]|nr:ATP-binding protein [Rhodospirillaceae bacterium]
MVGSLLGAISQAEDQQRVFGKFERGGNLKPGQSGAGLGLALVKSFIELHGGKVTLQSEPGRGTSVVSTIPTAPRRR